MTSKAIDKENSSSFGNLLLSNTKGLGLGSNPKSFNANQLLKCEKTNSTPIISSEKKSLLNKEIINTTGKQRRALGDVLNTAPNRQNSIGLGVTPKVDRTFNIENTPSGKPGKSFSKNFKLNELQQQIFKNDKNDEDLLQPVEHFIGSKYDNFDDLFSDGRLSELFLMAENSKFSTNLNQRGSSYGDGFEEKVTISKHDENDMFEMELKKVKKSLKKMTKKCELKSQEIECLDDLMPKIFEDSFEDN